MRFLDVILMKRFITKSFVVNCKIFELMDTTVTITIDRFVLWCVRLRSGFYKQICLVEYSFKEWVLQIGLFGGVFV